MRLIVDPIATVLREEQPDRLSGGHDHEVVCRIIFFGDVDDNPKTTSTESVIVVDGVGSRTQRRFWVYHLAPARGVV